MRLSLKEQAMVAYWLGSVLLLHVLHVISLPLVLLCSIFLLLSGLFLCHLFYRDYSYFVHIGFVSKERYYLQILSSLVSVDQSILNRLSSKRKHASNLFVGLRLYITHYIDLLSHSLLLLYSSLRYNLLVFASILDQCLLLVFLIAHSAFEAAIPAHGAIIGSSSSLFAVLSCLLAGSVEVLGEHDPLVMGDCCKPAASIEKRGMSHRFFTAFLAVVAFFSHFTFAAVVLDECFHPLLSLPLPAILPYFTPYLFLYGLNFLLSVSYAAVFSKMIMEAFHAPRSWSTRNTILFLLLSTLSGGVMFYEFHAHISLSVSYFPSLLLASFMSFTRSGLLLLAAQGEHKHPHSQQMYAFEWMKFFASLAVGIIAGHEFYEFLLVMQLAPSITFLTISVLTAVISGFVVEGAFFGHNKQNDSMPKGFLFTHIFSYFLPQAFYTHISDVVPLWGLLEAFAFYFIPSPFLFKAMTILNTASCLGLYLFQYTLPNNKHFVDYKKSDLLEGNKDLRASKKTSIQKSRSIKADKINNRSVGILKSSLHPKAGNISLQKRKELLFKKKHTVADKKFMEFLNQQFKDEHTKPSDLCLPCTSPENNHNLINTNSSKSIMNKPVLKTSDDLCTCYSINDVASPRTTDFFSYLRHFSSYDTPLKSIKN